MIISLVSVNIRYRGRNSVVHFGASGYSGVTKSTTVLRARCALDAQRKLWRFASFFFKSKVCGLSPQRLRAPGPPRATTATAYPHRLIVTKGVLAVRQDVEPQPRLFGAQPRYTR